MLLPYNLKRVRNAACKHAGIQKRGIRAEDIIDIRLLKDEHTDAAEGGGDRELRCA